MPTNNNHKGRLGSGRSGIRRATIDREATGRIASGRVTRSRGRVSTGRGRNGNLNYDLVENLAQSLMTNDDEINQTVRRVRAPNRHITNSQSMPIIPIVATQTNSVSETGGETPPINSNSSDAQPPPDDSNALLATLVPMLLSSSPSTPTGTLSTVLDGLVTTSVKSTPTTITLKRLNKELSDFLNDPPENCTAGLVESNLLEWKAKIIGPAGSPYENGVFRIAIDIPHDYPFHPPLVRFLTKIYHCNISRDGYICLDVLDHQWSPALTIDKVLLSIVALLTDANPDDPVEGTIADLYVSNRQEHDKIAREWTRMYANRDVDSD